MKKSFILLPITGFCLAFSGPNNFDARDAGKNLLNPSLSYMSESVFNNTFLQCSLNESSVSDSNLDTITYFRNLYEYSPINSHGSCGYVSFAQYLSYYDTFYNDSIVADCFEANQGNTESLEKAKEISPGVKRASYPEGSEDLYNYVQTNKTTDYQAYLMSIVNNAYNRDETNYSCSTHMRDYHYIVDSINAFANANFTYVSPSDFLENANPTSEKVVTGFETYVKKHLDNNEPVMLHIARHVQTSSEDDYYADYHSVVAYYYDDEGIHANFGWGSSSTDVIIEGNGYYITEAGVIDFSKVDETHSNNYMVSGQHYCGCGVETNHSYKYSRYSTEKHKAKCDCGYEKLENHTVKLSLVSTKLASCTKCYALVDLSSTKVDTYE